MTDKKNELIKNLKKAKKRTANAKALYFACEEKEISLRNEIFGSYDCDCDCCYTRCNAEEHASIKEYESLKKRREKLSDNYIEVSDEEEYFKTSIEGIDLDNLRNIAIEAMKRAKIINDNHFALLVLRKIQMKDHLAISVRLDCDQSTNMNNILISLRYGLENTNVKLKTEGNIMEGRHYYYITFYTEKINYDN